MAVRHRDGNQYKKKRKSDFWYGDDDDVQAGITI